MFTLIGIVVAVLGITPIIAALESLSSGKPDDLKVRTVEARIARIQALTNGTEARTAVIVATAEDKKAQETNKVIKQDVEIEILKLKQLQLEQKLGVVTQEFTPQNYD